MTLIEFFDSSATENIVGILYAAPERAVFVGDRRRKMEKALGIYRTFLAKKGISTSLSYKAVNRNKLSNIIAVFSEIIEENEECVFDLTGGEELYLVAVGILLERYPERVRVRRFNLNAQTASDPATDTSLPLPAFALSAEDNIAIHGGTVVKEGMGAVHTHTWELSDEFFDDVDKIWQIAQPAPRFWNAQTTLLGLIDAWAGKEESLTLTFSQEKAEKMLLQKGWRTSCDSYFLSSLSRAGLIRLRSSSVGDEISFSYKDAQTKRILTTAGLALELKIAKHMRLLRDGDGALYNDVRVGIVIDWDITEEENAPHTFNEIDVIAMKDTIPVFISCKNGDIDMDELYKLSSVAYRFGGKYTKKVLIATELDKLGPKAEYVRARAEDMEIRLIEDVDKMSDGELDRVLRSVWSN